MRIRRNDLSRHVGVTRCKDRVRTELVLAAGQQRRSMLSTPNVMCLGENIGDAAGYRHRKLRSRVGPTGPATPIRGSMRGHQADFPSAARSGGWVIVSP